MTTNVAEWAALVCAMNYAHSALLAHKQKGFDLPLYVQLVGDSQLIINQARQTFKVKEPRFLPFFEESQELKRLILATLRGKHKAVTYTWVRRELNLEADRAGHLKGF